MDTQYKGKLQFTATVTGPSRIIENLDRTSFVLREAREQGISASVPTLGGGLSPAVLSIKGDSAEDVNKVAREVIEERTPERQRGMQIILA